MEYVHWVSTGKRWAQKYLQETIGEKNTVTSGLRIAVVTDKIPEWRALWKNLLNCLGKF